MQSSLFERGCPVLVVVCVARKPRPCPSYSRRRDRINLGPWRSLYKGGGGVHSHSQSWCSTAACLSPYEKLPIQRMLRASHALLYIGLLLWLERAQFVPKRVFPRPSVGLSFCLQRFGFRRRVLPFLSSRACFGVGLWSGQKDRAQKYPVWVRLAEHYPGNGPR